MCICQHIHQDVNTLHRMDMIGYRHRIRYTYAELPAQCRHLRNDWRRSGSSARRVNYRSDCIVPNAIQCLRLDRFHQQFQSPSRGKIRWEHYFQFGRQLHSRCSLRIFFDPRKLPGKSKSISNLLTTAGCRRRTPDRCRMTSWIAYRRMRTGFTCIPRARRDASSILP